MSLRRSFLACTLPVSLAALSGCHHVTVAPTPSPDLELRADQEAHASTPTGIRIGPALMGVAYEKDGFTDFRIPLETNTCYTFGYAGDPGVAKFSIYAFDPAGKRLDSSRGRANEGVFNLCAKTNGVFRIQGKVPEGAGHFAIVGYAVKGPEIAPPAVVVVAPQLDIPGMIAAQAAAAAPGATRLGELYSGAGDQSEWFTPLEAGKCYWFVGAGEQGKVKRLSIYLWDPQNHRITDSKSDNSSAMVGHCPQVPGMYRFQAKLESGKGDYKVGLYAK